jgi:hypothetical protein
MADKEPKKPTPPPDDGSGLSDDDLDSMTNWGTTLPHGWKKDKTKKD